MYQTINSRGKNSESMYVKERLEKVVVIVVILEYFFFFSFFMRGHAVFNSGEFEWLSCLCNFYNVLWAWTFVEKSQNIYLSFQKTQLFILSISII